MFAWDVLNPLSVGIFNAVLNFWVGSWSGTGEGFVYPSVKEPCTQIVLGLRNEGDRIFFENYQASCDSVSPDWEDRELVLREGLLFKPDNLKDHIGWVKEEEIYFVDSYSGISWSELSLKRNSKTGQIEFRDLLMNNGREILKIEGRLKKQNSLN